MQMGRMPTFQDNYNDLLKFSLADLKRHGYMIGWCSAALTWSRNGNKRAAINIAVNLSSLGPGNYVQLDYTVDEHPMSYRIELVQVPSNLGKGQVWYFVCPITGERCRTLYKAGKYFASRKALKGTLYESQTYSKHYRWLDKTYGTTFKVENAFDDLFKPYAKSFYRGQPTPKARKILKWQRENDIANGKEPKSWQEYVYGLKYDCGK